MVSVQRKYVIAKGVFSEKKCAKRTTAKTRFAFTLTFTSSSSVKNHFAYLSFTVSYSLKNLSLNSLSLISNHTDVLRVKSNTVLIEILCSLDSANSTNLQNKND